MISCTEFIPLYSELFKFLEEKGGKAEVEAYWNHISDTYVSASLGKCAEKHGLRGCWEYWSKSLNEEACDFRMTLDEENGEFSIEMFCCPSKKMLNDMPYTKPYRDYCGHCGVLYSRVLEKFSIERTRFDISECDNAKCVLSFKEKR